MTRIRRSHIGKVPPGRSAPRTLKVAVLALANGLTAVREFHRPSDLLGLRSPEASCCFPRPADIHLRNPPQTSILRERARRFALAGLMAGCRPRRLSALSQYTRQPALTPDEGPPLLDSCQPVPDCVWLSHAIRGGRSVGRVSGRTHNLLKSHDKSNHRSEATQQSHVRIARNVPARSNAPQFADPAYIRSGRSVQRNPMSE
jgi:hypothetical protein